MAMELPHLPLEPQPLRRLRVNKYGRPFILGLTDVTLREHLRATLVPLLLLGPPAANAVRVRQVALQCHASESSVRKLLRLLQRAQREHPQQPLVHCDLSGAPRGSGAPEARKRTKLQPHVLQWLQQRVEQRPEALLSELCRWLNDELHVAVSVSTMSRWLSQKLGVTRKRVTPVALQRERPELQLQRQTFREQQQQRQWNPLRMLFVDETGVDTTRAACRHYARAPRGVAAHVFQSASRGRRINVLAAVGVLPALTTATATATATAAATATATGSQQITASAAPPAPASSLQSVLRYETVVNGGVKAVHFEQFIERQVLPLVRATPGMVVVMDNASIHKSGSSR